MSNKTMYYNEYAAFYDLRYEEMTPASSLGYKDPDNEWFVGESGAFIFKMPTFINTIDFCKSANFYKEHSVYTLHEGNPEQPTIYNSQEYNDFWKQEEDRRRHGYTIPNGQIINGELAPLRVTGKHYGFLNFARILRVPDKILQASIDSGIVPDEVIKKEVDFPRFFGSQYMWFKTKEFAKRNGFHNIVAKSRRAGYSYMEAWDCADAINMNKNVTVLLGAYDKKYLTQGDATAMMALNYLQFLEEHTNFVRYIAIKDPENEIQLGYKEEGSKLISGYKSKILITTFFNNPDAAIGKDAIEIKLEELSNFPNFNEAMNVTEPVTRAGNFLVGQITGFGTGGSKEAKWEIFSKNFYNPYTYNFMPFENIWVPGKRHKVCGYFKSYYLDMEPHIDEHGNSLLYKTKQLLDIQDEEMREKKSASDYTVWRSQYARNPEEAFSDVEDNLFNSPELNEHIAYLENNKDIRYEDGELIRVANKGNLKDGTELKFFSNEEIRKLFPDVKTHPFINNVPHTETEDIQGCIRIHHRPIKIDGKVPDKLYRIWHDPYGVDKDLKQVTRKNSLGATYVYMRVNPYSPELGDILVASFVGRRAHMTDYNKIMLNLADYYNAKIMFENDRGQVINDFTVWKRLDRLELEPDIEYAKELQANKNRGFGISMGAVKGQRKMRGLTFLADWLYEVRTADTSGRKLMNLHYISDLPLLKELRKFNFDGNFDRVSTMIVGMYDRKESLVKEFKPRSSESKFKKFVKQQKY